jgi:hypothetical protein
VIKKNALIGLGVTSVVFLSVMGCSSGHTARVADAESSGGIAALCAFTQRAAIDPIRFADSSEPSHLHDFFGAKTVQEFDTAESLLEKEKSCTAYGDHSSYWVPTMLQADVSVEPIDMAVYLYAPNGSDVQDVVAPPNGLEMVTFMSAWKCSRSGPTSADLPTCASNAKPRLRLEFPHCWDGVNLEFDARKPHVVTTDAQCPETHPVVLPSIVLEIRYDLKSTEGISFSSGGLTSVHGDVLIAWNQESLNNEIDSCLRRGITCGLTWSTEIGV